MKAGTYVEMTGRVVDEPKEKKIGDRTVKEFAVAVDYSSGVNFFDVSLWGEEADAFRGAPGQWVQIEGTLRQDRWQDKDTQQGRSKVRINANFAQVIELGPTKAREAEVRDFAERLQVGTKIEASTDLPESAVSRGEIGTVDRLSGRTVTVKFDSGARATLTLDDASTLSILTPEQGLERRQAVER